MHLRLLRFFSLALVLGAALASQTAAQTVIPSFPKQPAAAPPKGMVPLKTAIDALKATIDRYQQQRSVQASGLPPLSKAEFGFQTVTAGTTGGGVDVYVFSVGGKHGRKRTEDLLFTYVPQPPPTLKPRTQLPSAADQLLPLMEKVAAAVGNSGSSVATGDLAIDAVTVTLAFAVDNDLSGGFSIPVSILTFGPKFDRDHSTTQTVKLTFQSPSRKRTKQ